jgi:DnaJ homolog subfamily C member 13
MRALIEEGSAELGGRMQALALAEAALPRHLIVALFGTSRPQLRHLSRHLVGLWATGHPPTMALLKRIFVSIAILLDI